MLKIILIATLLILNGCAAPPEVSAKATLVLKGSCLEMFESRFQRFMANIRPPIFAVANDSSGQSCGMASMSDAHDQFFTIGTTNKIEAIAIARCEAGKPMQLKAVCKVFARGNNIVWDQKEKIGLE